MSQRLSQPSASAFWRTIIGKRALTVTLVDGRLAFLSDFEVIRELSRGGMARLLLAKNRDGELRVLKLIREDRLGDGAFLPRFEREAQLGARLNHPNIARVFGSHLLNGSPCIEMELIDGLDLTAVMMRARVRGVSMPVAVAVDFAITVLDALAYAHAVTDEDGHPLAIVHRDLSPNNLMISRSGEIKIIDFGVARGDVDDFRTAPEVRLGTLRYMSPEQARRQLVDHRSDQYTVASVLFELLAGEPLVTSGPLIDVLEAISYRVAPRLDDAFDVPSALADVVAQALAKNRDRRFESTGDFARALEAALPERGPSLDRTLAELVRMLDAEERNDLDRTRLQESRPADRSEEDDPTRRSLLAPTRVDAPTKLLPETRRGTSQHLGSSREVLARGVGLVVLVVGVTAATYFVSTSFPRSAARDDVTKVPQPPPTLDAPTPSVNVRAEEAPSQTSTNAEPVPSLASGSEGRLDGAVQRVDSRETRKVSRPVRAAEPGPLRRKLAAASTPEALFEVHDLLESRASNLTAPPAKEAINQALFDFRRGGGAAALKRAVDLLEGQ